MPKVLIVDDTEDVRFLYHTVLSRSGFEAEEASNGPEALALLAEHELPDAVVLDVQMPDMDGWDTLQAIRSDPGSKDVPVILCTVKSHDDDTRRAWALGCDGFLSKPFTIEDLTGELTVVTARSHAERSAVRTSRALGGDAW
jgi:CheY-like chemotaxis protein